jgi:imidazolonepropionase
VSRVLIRGARQLLTLRGPSSPRRGKETQELAVIEDGALLAENGIVLEAGPARRLDRLVSSRSARVIDATNKVILPGFVDASTHLLAAARERSRSPTKRRILADLDRYYQWFPRQGVTTLAARFSSAKEAALLRGFAGRCPAIAGIFGGDDADALLRAGGAAQVEVFCPEGGMDLTQQLLFVTARRAGCAIRVRGPGAAEAGLRGDAHVIENPDLRERAAVDALAMSASMVLLTPLSAGRRAARRLLDGGAAVALATGFGPELPRTPSPALLISWAVHEMGMSPEETITSFTVNAAHALGAGRTLGTLEAGKAADLLILDCPDYRDLATHPGVNLVSMVMKGGQIAYREPSWNP